MWTIKELASITLLASILLSVKVIVTPGPVTSDNPINLFAFCIWFFASSKFWFLFEASSIFVCNSLSNLSISFILF